MMLVDIFRGHKGRVAHKHPIHLEAYEGFFERFKNIPVNLLEIGIGDGGSLQLWKKYFDKGVIAGIDVVDLRRFEEETGAKISVGSQDDTDFLKYVAQDLGHLNIVIDDGSHICSHQILTFETLFPMLEDGGIYICEDTHTSYREAYGGGFESPGSFVEYVKKMIDSLHRSEVPDHKFTEVWDSVFSIHFYPNAVIIEKRNPGSWGGAEMRGD